MKRYLLICLTILLPITALADTDNDNFCDVGDITPVQYYKLIGGGHITLQSPSTYPSENLWYQRTQRAVSNNALGANIIEDSPLYDSYLLDDPEYLGDPPVGDIIFHSCQYYNRHGNLVNCYSPSTGYANLSIYGACPGDGYLITGQFYQDNGMCLVNAEDEDLCVPPEEENEDEGTPEQCEQLCGDPINLTTGNSFQTQTDLQSPQSTLKRYYNSSSSRSQTGNGWTIDFSQYVRFYSDPENHEQATNDDIYAVPPHSSMLPGETMAKVFRPDGKVITFRPTGNEYWHADGSSAVTLKCISTDPTYQSCNTSEVVVKKTGVTEIYDSLGRLEKIRYLSGFYYDISYWATSSNRIFRAMPYGDYTRALSFYWTEYSWGWGINSVYDGNGFKVLYIYDAIGNLVHKSDYKYRTESTSRFYLYEDPVNPKALTGIIDEEGVRTNTWAFDLQGRATSSATGSGLDKVELEYVSATQSKVKTYTTSTVFSEETFDFGLNAGKMGLSNVAELPCTDCVNGSHSYTYDANGFVETKTKENGEVIIFERNSRGLITKRTESDGGLGQQITVTMWHPIWPVPLTIETALLLTTNTYDSFGKLLTESRKDKTTNETRIITYTYNTNDLIETINGSRTDVNDLTTYTYNTSLYLETITNALGHVTLLENYDKEGRVGKITSPNGIITLITYTRRGWTGTINIDGDVTTFDYYPNGLLKSSTSPSGNTLHYEYNDSDDIIKMSDRNNNFIEYVRDNMGNILETNIKDNLSQLKSAQTNVFNALGQLTQTLGNNSQINALTYNNEGQIESDKDALNNTISTQYDALNRVKKVVDPNAAETSYSYDIQNNITDITDAENKTTRYEYNAFGDLVKLISPDTGTTIYTYDLAGNLLTQLDSRGVTATYTYDALNRRLTKSFTDPAENITFTYDSVLNGNKGLGRLTSVTDQSGSTNYVYNNLGEITQDTKVISGKTFVTNYGYDLHGRLTSITHPSGRVFTYTLDNLDRIIGLSNTYSGQTKTLASNMTYLPFGPNTGLTYGNNKTLSLTYDLDYRLTDKTVSGISQYAYGYDLVNNIASISNALNISNNQTFTYDDLSRLLTATGQYGSLGYTYDNIGNRLTKTENVSIDTYNYSSTSHWLDSVTGSNPRNYTFDASGNTLTKDSLTFTYNQQGRFQTASTVGVNATYLYNYKGERVAKNINGSQTFFIYDLTGQLIAEADVVGTVTRNYAYISGQRVVTIDNGNYYYIHTNHLDAPIALTDEAGATQWKAHYNPFGKTIIEIDNITMNSRFPGQYFDSETGLHYNYFRDYDPEIGRYIQSDPIGLAGGISTYGYALQNPINYFDPDGRLVWFGIPAYVWVTTGGATVVVGCGLSPGCRDAFRPDNSNTISGLPEMDNPFPIEDQLPPVPIEEQLPPREAVPPQATAIESVPGATTTDRCSPAEEAQCAAQCGGAHMVQGCYVTVRWKTAGFRGGSLIKSSERTVNCNCDDEECN